MGRRAQFFILAAVILSTIILSFGYTINLAKVSREPESFQDYTYEVKKESGAVIDWEVYSGFSEDTNLSHFIELLIQDSSDKNPNAKVLYVYGNSANVTVVNTGVDDVSVEGEIVSGGGEEIESNLEYGDSRIYVGGIASDAGVIYTKTFVPDDDRSLEVEGTDWSQIFYFDNPSRRKLYVVSFEDLDGDIYGSIS